MPLGGTIGSTESQTVTNFAMEPSWGQWIGSSVIAAEWKKILGAMSAKKMAQAPVPTEFTRKFENNDSETIVASTAPKTPTSIFVFTKICSLVH